MTVTFRIHFHTVWGQTICITGSIPQLGGWNPAAAREMNHTGDGNWQLRLELAGDIPFVEYNYFLRSADEQRSEEWERPHRIVFDGHVSAYTLYDHWQTYPANPALYSSAFTRNIFARPRDTRERIVRSGKNLLIKVFAPRVEQHQSVAIAGNQDCIGNWHPDKALLLSCGDTFPEWRVALDADTIRWPLEYKFLVCDSLAHRFQYWEIDENRILSLPSRQAGETVVVSGLVFRDGLPPLRCAGTVIPVFSLRSEQSFGVGDWGDLRLMVDWAKKTNQRFIQVLPVNDTTMTHTRADSYPYSAISIHALHPMYVCLPMLGLLKDAEQAARYEAIRQELNSRDAVDYEEVNRRKLAYCRAFFRQEGYTWLDTPEFESFFRENESWLSPYAAYCSLRDRFHTSDFTQWGAFAVYDEGRIARLTTKGGEAWPEIAFTYFLQYVLHRQFKSVSGYARERGVVLKGDLPIGVNRTGMDAWKEPQYFNMQGQAGAPPDDFSATGQNWMFPTYNWDEMEKDGFSWWKQRFAKLNDYFDSFRIDHILGFFRIWEIPTGYVQGLCGHFNPALSLAKEEIERYGLSFREEFYTIPHLHRKYLPELFGELAGEAEQTWLMQETADYVVLKPVCDTQRKIESLFAGKADVQSQRMKEGLYAIANEVLFLRDPREPSGFHPRILAGRSYAYKELDEPDRHAFDQLYRDFFYHRHNDFWKTYACKRLTPLVASTGMLVCGEDLGMIPQSVPEVMSRLRILTLEIERMPKAYGREFTDLKALPYLSVCTTSTHDMSPLRNWWKEDAKKTGRYYRQVLHREGDTPPDCAADIAVQIIRNHLDAPSMLAIFPLQDWLATDDSLKRTDIEAERINVPANPANYWRYRMHIPLEQLMNADSLNERIRKLISESGRE